MIQLISNNNNENSDSDSSSNSLSGYSIEIIDEDKSKITGIIAIFGFIICIIFLLCICDIYNRRNFRLRWNRVQ